jgi:hypothetical protein
MAKQKKQAKHLKKARELKKARALKNKDHIVSGKNQVFGGWMKNYHQKTCTYDFTDLENETTDLINTMTSLSPISFVQRTFNHCQRWMAY